MLTSWITILECLWSCGLLWPLIQKATIFDRGKGQSSLKKISKSKDFSITTAFFPLLFWYFCARPSSDSPHPLQGNLWPEAQSPKKSFHSDVHYSDIPANIEIYWELWKNELATASVIRRDYRAYRRYGCSWYTHHGSIRRQLISSAIGWECWEVDWSHRRSLRRSELKLIMKKRSWWERAARKNLPSDWAVVITNLLPKLVVYVCAWFTGNRTS